MGLFDDKKTYIGVALGMAAAGIVKEIFSPSFRGLGRPLAKATIKSGLHLYEAGREQAAHLTEVFEDLVAEVRAEREQELRHGAAGLGPAPPTSEPGSVQ